MATRPRAEIDHVSGSPAKPFFISMLTRDIELEDAILDLLDNCVDGVIRSRSRALVEKDSLEGYWAKIGFDENKFVIEDNCGGIPWKLAESYAFRMGPSQEHQAKPGTIGLVGIGMKRAIFKMGRECYVHSNHKDDTFFVSILPGWFSNENDWDFPAERESPVKNNHGTIIEISQLEEGVKRAFEKGSSFRSRFPSTVAESYSYLIEKGFKVKINGDEVRRKTVKICFEDNAAPRKAGQKIRPYIYKGTIEGVHVFLALGYRSRFRSQEEQDSDAEENFAAREAGWTIVCNDRVVLSNDRTVKTGWGFGGVPNFHNQFSCIAGIVEFRSDDTRKLPVTTTKRGIDTGKDIYAVVRQRMQDGIKLFTRNTNRWKGNEDELKKRFDRSPYLDLRELKAIAEKLLFSSVRGGGVQYQFKPDLPEKVKVDSTRRISFARELAEIEMVSNYLFDGLRKPDEVGETCFERALREAKQ